MTEDRITTLYIGATRYYLGRSTYAVKDYCDILCFAWEELPDVCRATIRRDVEAAVTRDNRAREEAGRISWAIYPLGQDADRDQWLKVRKLWEEKADTVSTIFPDAGRADGCGRG